MSQIDLVKKAIKHIDDELDSCINVDTVTKVEKMAYSRRHLHLRLFFFSIIVLIVLSK